MDKDIFYHCSSEIYTDNMELMPSVPMGSESFFSETLGHYGKQVLQKGIFSLHLGGNVRWATYSKVTELVYEWVRQCEFPEYPSRLSCVFANSSLNDVMLWKPCWDENDEYHTYKVATLSSKKVKSISVESSWLVSQSNCVNSWSEMIDYARKYWTNTKHPNPLPEVLLALPVRIIGKVAIN